MKLPASLRWSLLAVFMVSSGIAGEAHAVTRTCGPNALTNTGNVLCASGTCTATLVRVTTAIEVTDAGCDFDLGGRALSIERNFQMTGLGFIRILNAGNVTITSTGRLKARGDFVLQNGAIVAGGLISITSSGVISLDGQIDVTGDSAGIVRLAAAGDVTLQPGSLVNGIGISSFPDLGMLFTDGGELDVISDAGNITMGGDVSLNGSNQGTGGIIDLTAARNLTLNRSVDVSGGGGDGGEFTADVGDHIFINANINADSSVGGGFGGLVDLTAGDDPLGGIVAGGNVDVNGASLLLRGSYTDQLGGDGGELDVFTPGRIRFFGSGMAIRADAGTNFDGSGGAISLDSGDADFFGLGAGDGDIEVGGIVSLGSGNAGGDGGAFDASSGRDLTITAAITANGFDSGGDITGNAGRTIVLNGVLTAQATTATGDGGVIDFESGIASDAASLGSITVQKNLIASGGASNGTRQSIALAGCGLSVFSNVKVDGSAGTSANNLPGGATIDLIARRPIQLGTSSQYLANPGGSIVTTHPNGANPVIGAGVVFNPARIDNIVAAGPYPNCAVCGDGVRQPGEVCDKGAGADGACCNDTCRALVCVTATPTPTLTATRTPTPTRTATQTPTRTATATPTATALPVASATTTALPARTATPTPTLTATATATFTGAPPPTATPSVTASASPSATPTTSATVTLLATPTSTVTVGTSPTATLTGFATASPTVTPTATATVTASSTRTATPVATNTATTTASSTASATATPVPTVTPTITATATATATDTPTVTAVASPSPTTTATPSASVAPTPSLTPTPTPTASRTATRTPTPSPTATVIPASATPTLPATPLATPTAGRCGGSTDVDGDGICDELDDCPDVANADQADLDADGAGDVCDDADAELDLRRARVRSGTGAKGEILVKGELALPMLPAFHPELGLEVQVVDTLTLDQTFVFVAADCVSLKSGRITCKAADGHRTARFDPLAAKPGRLRFALRFQGLAITEPFAPALLVRLTSDPATDVLGIDRVGSLDACRVTAKALLCVAQP